MNVLATVAQHAVIRGLARWVVGGGGGGGGEREKERDRSRSSPAKNTTVVASPPSHAAADVASPPSQASSSTAPPPPPTPPSLPPVMATVRPGYATPSAISTALLVSSCTKLFPILLVIWPTTSSTTSPDSSSSLSFASRAASYVGWAVLLNNIEALLILLDCGYVAATGLAVAGVIARWAVETWALGLVGLSSEGDMRVGIGDMGGVVEVVRGWVG